MTDARIPDRWLHDRRLLRLSDSEFRTFVTSLTWCVSNRTDGRLEHDDLAMVPTCRPEQAGALVRAGLWEPRDGGWQVVDFLNTQSTATQLAGMEHKRHLDRERQARYRAKVTSADEPKDSHVTRDVTRDITGGTKARQVQGQALTEGPPADVEPAEKPNADLPHRCRTCSEPIRHRGGLCRSCSDAVIAANSTLRSEPDPDKSTPKPNGDVSDDPDREFRRAI